MVEPPEAPPHKFSGYATENKHTLNCFSSLINTASTFHFNKTKMKKWSSLVGYTFSSSPYLFLVHAFVY